MDIPSDPVHCLGRLTHLFRIADSLRRSVGDLLQPCHRFVVREGFYAHEGVFEICGGQSIGKGGRLALRRAVGYSRFRKVRMSVTAEPHQSAFLANDLSSRFVETVELVDADVGVGHCRGDARIAAGHTLDLIVGPDGNVPFDVKDLIKAPVPDDEDAFNRYIAAMTLARQQFVSWSDNAITQAVQCPDICCCVIPSIAATGRIMFFPRGTHLDRASLLFLAGKRLILWTVGEPENTLRVARQVLVNNKDQIDKPLSARRKRIDSGSELVFELGDEARSSGQLDPATLAKGLNSPIAQLFWKDVGMFTMASTDSLCRNDDARGMALILLLACHEYQRVHGEFPLKLEQLVPVILDVIPLDPMIEIPTPMHYRQRDEGWRQQLSGALVVTKSTMRATSTPSRTGSSKVVDSGSS